MSLLSVTYYLMSVVFFINFTIPDSSTTYFNLPKKNDGCNIFVLMYMTVVYVCVQVTSWVKFLTMKIVSGNNFQ